MGKIELIPKYNRPREKAYLNGVDSLSDSELLAILIQSGTKNKSALDISNELISAYNGIENIFKLTSYELCKHDGISKVKAIQIEAIKEIFIRINKKSQHINQQLKLSSGLDVYNYLSLNYEKALQEKLIVLYLNSKNIVIYEQILSVGNDSMAVTNNKLICKTKLLSLQTLFCLREDPAFPYPETVPVICQATLLRYCLCGIPVQFLQKDHLPVLPEREDNQYD